MVVVYGVSRSCSRLPRVPAAAFTEMTMTGRSVLLPGVQKPQSSVQSSAYGSDTLVNRSSAGASLVMAVFAGNVR